MEERECLYKIEADAAALLMLVRMGLEDNAADWYSIWTLILRMSGLVLEGGEFAFEGEDLARVVA